VSELEASQDEKSVRFATATAPGANSTVAGVLGDGSAGRPNGAPLRRRLTAGKPIRVQVRAVLLVKLRVAN
jgi:hypothetical protein